MGTLQIANTSATTGDRTPSGLFDDVRIYGGIADATFLDGVRSTNPSSVPEPSAYAVIAGGLALITGSITCRRKSC